MLVSLIFHVFYVQPLFGELFNLIFVPLEHWTFHIAHHIQLYLSDLIFIIIRHCIFNFICRVLYFAVLIFHLPAFALARQIVYCSALAMWNGMHNIKATLPEFAIKPMTGKSMKFVFTWTIVRRISQHRRSLLFTPQLFRSISFFTFRHPPPSSPLSEKKHNEITHSAKRELQKSPIKQVDSKYVSYLTVNS